MPSVVLRQRPAPSKNFEVRYKTFKLHLKLFGVEGNLLKTVDNSVRSMDSPTVAIRVSNFMWLVCDILLWSEKSAFSPSIHPARSLAHAHMLFPASLLLTDNGRRTDPLVSEENSLCTSCLIVLWSTFNPFLVSASTLRLVLLSQWWKNDYLFL